MSSVEQRGLINGKLNRFLLNFSIDAFFPVHTNRFHKIMLIEEENKLAKLGDAIAISNLKL